MGRLLPAKTVWAGLLLYGLDELSCILWSVRGMPVFNIEWPELLNRLQSLEKGKKETYRLEFLGS